MTEFRPLIDATRVVRRRTLANNLLQYWNRCVAWSLAAVLLAAAFLPLQTVILAAAILAVLATVVAGVATWVSRPSTYEAACRLDQAAGLHDRLSTALHFAADENPDEMVKHQRRDALGRLAQADPRALFTLRIPPAIGRTAAIAIAVVGLMVYRINHKAPLLAVSEQVAQSRLARAILTPQPPEKEKEFKEKLVLTDEREAVDADSNDKAGLDQLIDPESEQSSASQEQGEAGSPSDDQAGSDEGETGEADPANSAQDAQAQQGDGREPGDAQKRDKPEPGAPQQQDKPSSSLAQKITQALKDLLAKATGQTPKEDPNEKKMSPPGNDPAQNQNGQQNPNNQNPGGQPAKPDSKETTDAKANGAGPQLSGQQGEGNAPNGRGSGSPQMTKNPMLETNPTADVVPLAATTFKGQASVLTTAQAGQALVPLRDTAALPTATTNGAEQGDVPLRYRTYVQQYFNHPDPNHPDKVQR